MGTLDHRIDFAGVIVVEMANPNGDPVGGNVPRTDYDGYGEISDVCIKRKIRDRLQEAGWPILIQSNDKATDGHKSLKSRTMGCPGYKAVSLDPDAAIEFSCKTWIDTRAFGGVLPSDNKDIPTWGVRGPVSIGWAKSLDVVDAICMQITKSTNALPNPKGEDRRSSDTIGEKFVVRKGAYTFFGSIFPQLALKTGFTCDDALLIKDALCHLFDNDASSARPAGSMSIDTLYWWEHNTFNGQHSPMRVKKSLEFSPLPEYPYYTAVLHDLDGLTPEIIKP